MELQNFLGALEVVRDLVFSSFMDVLLSVSKGKKEETTFRQNLLTHGEREDDL